MYGFWCERPLPPEFAPLLAEVGTLIGSGSVTSADFLAQAAHIHAIIAGASSRFDDAFMRTVPQLKVIARTGIGIDNINIPAATAHGIAVCNAPDAPTRATAEHAILLMFAVTKHLRRIESALRNGERRDFYTQQQAIEIEGLRLGIVGLGRIGRKVAQYGRGLGMVVMGYDPFLTPAHLANLPIEYAETLEMLLAQADVVSLHIPATPANHHLMNAARFAQMKPGAYLINTARGSLVDETALWAALDSGHLHGAGLDVFDPEPPSAGNPLLHRDDVIATPHIGGVTVSSKQHFWQAALTQAVQVLTGEIPPHLVNPEVLNRS